MATDNVYSVQTYIYIYLVKSCYHFVSTLNCFVQFTHEWEECCGQHLYRYHNFFCGISEAHVSHFLKMNFPRRRISKRTQIKVPFRVAKNCAVNSCEDYMSTWNTTTQKEEEEKKHRGNRRENNRKKREKKRTPKVLYAISPQNAIVVIFVFLLFLLRVLLLCTIQQQQCTARYKIYTIHFYRFMFAHPLKTWIRFEYTSPPM